MPSQKKIKIRRKKWYEKILPGSKRWKVTKLEVDEFDSIVWEPVDTDARIKFDDSSVLDYLDNIDAYTYRKPFRPRSGYGSTAAVGSVNLANTDRN